ncbi:MAG: NAD(P)H-binding protein [Chloroflexota bacterium]|nr:NAD(P)H-binding protein [Chloroflexota bacterium]
MDVTVIGATGFVGSHLVPYLVGLGHRVRAVSRAGRALEWPSEVEALAGDVETGAGLDDALRGADALVHLVAIPRELRGRRFEEVNVGGVERVIEAAQRNEVTRIVHLSALGVADDPRLGFLFSKWRGEQVVRASGLDWRVLRPSLLFGPGDGFFNLIKTTLTWWSPGVVAIPGTGSERFQPLSVDDLAIAVEACLTDARRAASTYELGGPQYLSYREIVDHVMRATGKRRLKLNVPLTLISALTSVTDRILPIFPVSHDQIRSLSRPNYTELDAFERAFGVRPRSIDLGYLR